jgi:hypothetical protein
MEGMNAMATRPGPLEGWQTYMRQWRDEHPDAVARNRQRSKARARALALLKERYPDDYEWLYAQELADLADEPPSVILANHDCASCGRRHRVRS